MSAMRFRVNGARDLQRLSLDGGAHQKRPHRCNRFRCDVALHHAVGDLPTQNAARRSTPRHAGYASFRHDREMAASILLPARLGRVPTERLFFALAQRGHPLDVEAETCQVIPDNNGTPVAAA